MGRLHVKLAALMSGFPTRGGTDELGQHARAVGVDQVGHEVRRLGVGDPRPGRIDRKTVLDPFEGADPPGEGALGEGAPELLLVPQDDLHKVAWRDVAREHLNVRVTVLPSMPAVEARLKQQHAPPRPRWASLAFDAAGTQHARLRWVPIEQALSTRLWADNLRTPPTAGRHAAPAARTPDARSRPRE